MTDMKEFNSISGAVRNVVMEIVADGEVHNRNDIVSYIRSNVMNGSEVSEGIITGVLKNMVAANELEIIKRGVYRMSTVMNMNSSLADKAVSILEETKAKLNKICACNMLEITEEELEEAKKVGELIKIMDKEIVKFKKEEKGMK